MPSFRFIHAADIHLDSPLRGLAGHEGSLTERIRTATREAFEQLIDTAIAEQVAFLIISGDLYDGDWRDFKTGLFFVTQMGRLNEAEIPAFQLYGNHDAESQITRRLDPPGNVKVFKSRKPETFRLDELGVALHGQSFRQRDVTENLARTYPEPIAGAFNIGVLHTGLGGMGGHANYAPCTLDDLVNKGYDYWALGHVHQAQTLNERPHVVFPGNLQGRHARETGSKGACLVTVEDREIVDFVRIYSDVVRWNVIQVGLNDVASIGEVLDRVRSAIEDTVARCSEGRLLACRIELQGRTEVHDQLLAAEDQILAEARSSALGLGDSVAWVEKVVVSTEPTIDPQTMAERDDAIGDLRRMLLEASADTDLMDRLESDIGAMIRSLPHEVHTDIEDEVVRSAISGDYPTLIAEISPYLAARLTSGEG